MCKHPLPWSAYKLFPLFFFPLKNKAGEKYRGMEIFAGERGNLVSIYLPLILSFYLSLFTRSTLFYPHILIFWPSFPFFSFPLFSFFSLLSLPVGDICLKKIKYSGRYISFIIFYITTRIIILWEIIKKYGHNCELVFITG